MYFVRYRALSLCGRGTNVPWWLHIVVQTRCLWTCNELNLLKYVSVAYKVSYVDTVGFFVCS